MSTASFPTSIPSFGLIETEPLKVERIAREVEAIATKVGIGTRVGTDISGTGNVAVGNGTYYEIGSLSGNIVLTFQTTGATEGTEITLVRTGTTAHTITCNNGGTGAGTMAILPASTAGVASFVYMNSNWRLKHVSLFPLYDVGGPLTATANSDGFSLAGGTTSRTFTLSGGALSVTAPAAGASLTLAGNLTTTGAFNSIFTATGSYTYTLPGGTCTLASAQDLAAVTGAGLVGSNAAGYVSATVSAQLAEVKAIADAGMAVTKRTCTIDFAPGADNFAGLAGGVKTFSKNIGAATPANARLVGWSIGETITPFDDATHGDFDLEIGTAGDPNAIMTSTSVKAGATNFPKNGTAGVAGFNMCPIASTQYVAKLTSSVDLNTTTAGAIVVNLFYLVLA